MSDNESICSTGNTSDGDAIRVFVRVRPLVTDTTDIDRGACVEVDKERNAVIMQSKPDPKVFTFDEVADQSTTQEALFCSIGKKIIDGCISGYNGTIFAYGQTGSGKTFTMLGPHEDMDNFQHQLRGVIPRSFEYLFKSVKKEQEIHGDKLVFLCKCSFLEIYNEQIFDLLDTSTSSLQLRENIRRGVYVEGAQEQVVSSAHEAYQVLNRGWINRTVASTTMNHESSRSHAVFTVSIESKVNQNGVWNIKTSQLHLVDLAGSERQKDTNTTGQRLKEAGSINRSLSALGNVIMALVDIGNGKSRHIPYRDSKLSFLLRDSLGGNSKTYIVACIHPGSRCFGETLSTLQFARRAKLIKNKAVVNEDTQGSITHLQAEIKRLKEALAVFQQNSFVRSPSANSINSGFSEDISPSLENLSDSQSTSSRYRSYFLQSMYLREKSEADKKTLADGLKKQQEVCNRKEQALRQMKMVLKFREDALRKIEKVQKEGCDLTADDKDNIIENLRSEIKALQAINDHHPEVVKCQMESESMKAEIRRLRAEAKSREIDQQKAVELEKAFSELCTENGEMVMHSGHQHQVQDKSVVAATIEKQQAQLARLQEELEMVKHEMSEQLQKGQRELITKEAELVGVQKAKEELEKLFKAHQVRSQIERETRDDLHAETIKIMTTPKKGSSVLRNRFSVGRVMGSLDLSPAAEGLSIHHETPPMECAEEQFDGLREEISKLQDELRTAKSQLEEADRNMVNLFQEKSHLEAEKELRDKLHLSESKAWESKVSELTSELGKLMKEKTEFCTKEMILLSEVQDLRIMNEAADKKLKEIKDEARDFKAAKEVEIAKMDTKQMKLESKLKEVEEELDRTSKERDELKDNEDTLQATLDYNSEQLKIAEANVQAAKEEAKKLESSYMKSMSRISDLEHDKEKLMAQLKHETGAKDQQLVEALGTIELLRSEVQVRQGQVELEQAEVTRVQIRVAELTVECDRLTKTDVKKEEAISSMTGRVTELKTLLQDRDLALENITTELAEVKQQNNELNVTCKDLEKHLKEQNAAHKDAVEKLQCIIDAKEAEYEILVEDYNTAESFGAQLKTELKRITEKEQMLETEVTSLKSELAGCKGRLEAALNEKQELLQKRSQIDQHEAEIQMINAREMELEQKHIDLQKEFDVVLNQVDAYTRDNGQLQEEKIKLKKDLDEFQETFAKAKLEYELDKNDWHENKRTLRQQIKTLEEQVAFERTRAKLHFDDFDIENRHLKESITTLTLGQKEQEAEINRLKECTNNSYLEMDKLSSANEELKEENLRLKKEIDKLEAEFEEQLSENAKLSGHQNHLQKIAYLDKLKQQLCKQEKDNRILSAALEKCKCKNVVASLFSSTPTRTPSEERNFILK